MFVQVFLWNKTMKKIISFFLLLTLSGVSFAQTKKDEPKPTIQFEVLTHDFGKIYDGKPVEYEFVFTNTGKVPLILTNVQPGCGCTTPEWPREPIMPNQKSKIKAIYNAGSFRGSFSKGISVQSNAENANIQLTIKGVVEDTPKTPQSPVKIDVGGGF